MKKRYCAIKDCGRVLYPHEDYYCGICTGADDETTRTPVHGAVGVFVLPTVDRDGAAEG